MPADKLKEALAGLFAVITLVFFYLGQKIPMQASISNESFDVIALLNQLPVPHPSWLPSRWVVELISRHFQESQFQTEGMFILLIASTTAVLGLGILLFDKYFYRGWTKANQSSSASNIKSVKLLSLIHI